MASALIDALLPEPHFPGQRIDSRLDQNLPHQIGWHADPSTFQTPKRRKALNPFVQERRRLRCPSGAVAVDDHEVGIASFD